MITTRQARWIAGGTLGGLGASGVLAYKKRKPIKRLAISAGRKFEQLPPAKGSALGAATDITGAGLAYGLTRTKLARNIGITPLSKKAALISGGLGAIAGASVHPLVKGMVKWKREDPKKYKVAKNVLIGLGALELGRKTVVAGYGVKKGIDIARRARSI